MGSAGPAQDRLASPRQDQASGAFTSFALIKVYPAFTLVELLVVASVVALLIAILIPSLARTRETARMTVCQNNLHQLGIAITTYADTDDRLVPGDSSMGHDVWGSPSEGPTAGASSQPVNLGHLLASRVLSMPNSEHHLFYCPTLSITGAKWSFTYRNSGPYANTVPRGFEGWGKPGRTVNIGYELRDSIDGDLTNNPSVIARRLSQASRRALVADLFSWGSARWAHRTRYHFVRGDGSVSFFRDPGSPRYVYQRFDTTNPGDDYLAFQVFDKSITKGILWP